jgi:flagellar biosynthesis protein FlhA
MMDLSRRWPDFLLPVGIIACLMIIFVPLPAGVMDILLAANIAVAVMILLASIYVKTPLELSVFPALLLVTTLARLALNIGTTRLILTRGPIEMEAAAGGVIQSFSQFVTGDSLAVGFVIFAIIFVIQFVVITKGATRISEVSARFALDGLPGRQMAIDADLNSGAIDNNKARFLREETVAHAEFYGSMDGASKFVRGDAIAAVIITLINIVGGLAIGMSQGMTLGAASAIFTKLTIGDGLASQLPALLISLAAGLLVTRSTRKSNLPRESMNQVFARPIVLVITAMFLGLLILTELPKIPLFLLAAGCLIAAYFLIQQEAAEKANLAKNQPAKPVQNTELTIDKLLSNDVVEMELGVGLICLADARQGGNLLALITQIRKKLATDMGMILPKIRIRDNLKIDPLAFQIRIQGNVVEQGRLEPTKFMAVDDGRANGPLGDGIVDGMVEDQLTSYPAFWIKPEGAEAALNLGYQVQSAAEVLADQLQFAAIDYADQLLTRDATKQLIDELRKSSPAVVEDLVPDQMSIAQIQHVLKNLVKEGVSIRPLSLIVETLGDHANKTANHWELTEKVRIRLGQHISSGLSGANKLPISVFTIAKELENRIACSWERDRNEIRIDLSPTVVESIAFAIQDAAKKMVASGMRPIALVDQSIRPIISELAVEHAQEMFVLGTEEANGASIEVVGEVTIDQIASLSSAAA